ncbi:hypothetical protein KEM60_00694 [Austwickia sp. TVS 96-490-7B]|uniref:murein hydrolase activator EnvC family protein n=1 Tax=Austwickia sp. TVS 96-490-7B TaxID=2830843 RepID=UPI001C586529|nr:peptidoglycan DD-metalloendopeptidase family protein [Austwickia sp. TVS 96-490-7B]MBW3084506.1 hypothetical protein [Austwickia sp. TVS 96-490-7B]
MIGLARRHRTVRILSVTGLMLSLAVIAVDASATTARYSGAAPSLDPAVTSAPAPPMPTAASTQRAPQPAAMAPKTGRWAWPLSPRPAVARRFDPPAQRWLPGHRGLDLVGTLGAQVRAPADGTVAFAGSVAGRLVLSIDHDGGLRSTYEPVDSTLSVGTRVSRGDPIGTLTGEDSHCPPRSCLHLGVRQGEDYLDPLPFFAVVPVLLPLR